MARKEQLHEKAYRIAKTMSIEPRIPVELELAELGWTSLYTPLSFDDPRERKRTPKIINKMPSNSNIYDTFNRAYNN